MRAIPGFLVEKFLGGNWDCSCIITMRNSEQLFWKGSLVSKAAQECLGSPSLHGILGGLGLTGMSSPGQVGQGVIQIFWAKPDPFREVLGNVWRWLGNMFCISMGFSIVSRKFGIAWDEFSRAGLIRVFWAEPEPGHGALENVRNVLEVAWECLGSKTLPWDSGRFGIDWGEFS